MISSISNSVHANGSNRINFGSRSNYKRALVHNSEVKKVESRVTLMFSKLMQKIKIRKSINGLVSDVPRPLKSQARKLAKNNVFYSSLRNEPIYKAKNFPALALDTDSGMAYANKTMLKLDLLAEHDPNLFIGANTHPVHYMNSCKGYENFTFENFDADINKKLQEIAKNVK